MMQQLLSPTHMQAYESMLSCAAHALRIIDHLQCQGHKAEDKVMSAQPDFAAG